ncbi:Fructosamine-3-kinase [Portunus trituberculatus]|uniref:protein-ribulosamine 3-kinase n=1 Tax=Portunus trituberculatus TaxID=210409 RepID=A0A5B7ICY0_PORTR|nr:Fructosamine-3-kinase [Portunus trituberculatus]
MFDGEYEGLKAIQATGTVRVPTPHLALDNPAGGAVLVMEYLDMHGLHRKAGQLGTQLARLHLHNTAARDTAAASRVGAGTTTCVEQFGFHINTCCGYISQDNTWADDWLVFYSRKLDFQLNLIQKEVSE